ncbi:MAG: hypothetical protein HQ534_06125 [Armatimonadetes bacterium]|nr:hypothetical protein [Armatimonadota bacterium]
MRYSFLFIVILGLFINTCNKTTEIAKGSLFGTAQLEDQTDHSGIIVAVYESAYLDTTIVRINNEYPHIGVHINQHTEFDHRFQSPIKFTETDIEGDFLIKKIPVGVYNIVALKDSFGFKYIYEFEIEKNDNELTQQVTLYPDQYLSGDIFEDWIFETNHHYIIGEEGANSTNFSPDTILEIQPGAIIRIESTNDLVIYGNLFAQGEENNMFWITSNYGFGETLTQNNIDSTNFYYNFKLSPIVSVEENLIEWGKFDLANTGLLNQVNNLHMQNGIFRNSNCGFYCTDVDSTLCSNLLCEKITSERNAGIYFVQVDHGLIEKSIVIDCDNGLKVKDNCNPEIYNNYIFSNTIGIDISYYSSPQVYNNEFVNCEKAILNLNQSYSTIWSNYFETNYGFVTYRCYIFPLEIHYNNFNCSIYNMKTTPWGPSPQPTDINAENNYYYTINETEIQELIYDKNDFEPPQQQYYGEVFYQPFLTEEYPYAGIQGE